MSIKYRSRVSQYTGWVEFYCGLSIIWQIDHQSVTIAMVVCWQCVGKPLVEFQWGIEWWCISWKSASPIQPHPQCFALCYKAPVRWHAEDAICSLHLSAMADTRLISYTKLWAIFMYWPTSRLSVSTHQSLCWFSVSGVLYWLTCWTRFDQGIGRYMDQVSVKSRWSDRDQSAK